MKLMTLNAHSLRGMDDRGKLRSFVTSVLREKPDIIALQEINQSADTPVWSARTPLGLYRLNTQIPVRRDNYAALVAQALNQAGMECHWVWLPTRDNRTRCEVGVAMLSLGRPITNVRMIPMEQSALGIQVEGLPDWFYTVRMGWWGTAENSFAGQWKELHQAVSVSQEEPPVWLMGDFAAPDVVRGESYDTVTADGWFDTHRLAQYRDNGLTVSNVFDVWQEKLRGRALEGLRLDYIWCSKRRDIFSSRVIFNGMKEPVVSDHFGVMVETRA